MNFTAAVTFEGVRTTIKLLLLHGLLLLLLTMGCARFERQQPLSQADVAGLGQTTLTNSGLKLYMEQQLGKSLDEWPPLIWNLPKLTLVAYYFHPRLVAARSEWQRAEASLTGWRCGPQGVPSDPQTFSSEALHFSTGDVMPENGRVELAAAQLSKHTRQNEEAERRARLARFQFQSVSWQLRSGVRSNLLNYVAVRQTENLLEALESTCEKLVRSAELQVQIGSISYLDLSLWRLQLAQARLVLVQARLEKMDSRMRLAKALALPVSALLDIEVDYDFSQGPDTMKGVQHLRRVALLGRSDILTALEDYAVTEAVVRAELEKARPKADLPAGCWWDPQKSRWVANIDLWVPTLKRGGRKIAQAEARRIATAARLLDLQTEIIDEVERSAAVYRITAEEVEGVDELVESIAQHYTAIMERFKNGVAKAPDLLLARVKVVAGDTAKLRTRMKLHKALGNLEDTLQLPAEAFGYSSSSRTSRRSNNSQ